MVEIRHGIRILVSSGWSWRKPPSIRRNRTPLVCQRKLIPSFHYSHINRKNMSQSIESRSRLCPPPPTLLDQIRALDKSSELAATYTPLIIFHPTSSGIGNDASSDVVVGHVHTSLINSTLLNCKNEKGEPVFVRDRLKNRLGMMTDVLRLHDDIQLQKKTGRRYNHAEHFHDRTVAFEHVTGYLLSSGIITQKHSDVYPIYPFTEMMSNIQNQDDARHLNEKTVLAHVNRGAAPYLGIDSVGVHLNCYVCRNDGKPGAERSIEGVWLAKRASTKLHFPNYWDSTVAGGQPANLSLFENIIKEAHEEAGVPEQWIRDPSNSSDIYFSDHTHDPLTITTAKPDGTCMKRSIYFSFDLQVPHSWTPTPIDGEVSEFRLYSVQELEKELRFGESVRPSMRAVLLDFMMRHNIFQGDDSLNDLKEAMRRERLVLW